MNDDLEPNENRPGLKRLVDYLLQQRDDILSQWRSRIEAEGDASVLIKASRKEFYDHIPEFLDKLYAAFSGDLSRSPEGPAVRHGAQRWRLGMNIRETAREWGHLHQVLMGQIATFHDADPSFGFASLQRAYFLLVEYIHQGMTESIGEFHSLHRREAEARMRDLEAASHQWDELERRRGDYLREIFHDLNGGLSIIRLAAVLLKGQGLENELTEAVEEIVSTTEDMNQLLNDLLDLARLEAGREQLEITSFDASELLSGLCNAMRAMAQEKGLDLISEGETPLPVRGDRSKVQRIAQNLIINALTYTEAGRVEVGWNSELPERWLFYVQDTGPGLPSTSAGALARGFEKAGQDGSPDRGDGTGDTQESGSVGGEGIGLVIVHRLCELLDCVMEVESDPQRGTVFRIKLPVDYSET